MKKYKSISANLLHVSFDIPGKDEESKDTTTTKEVVFSQGTEVELPEDHPAVKDFLTKGLIKESAAPAKTDKTETKK